MKGHKIIKTAVCKTSVVNALKELSPVMRINFCNWLLKSIHVGEVEQQLAFFSDEAWFPLYGEVNSKKNRHRIGVQKI